MWYARSIQYLLIGESSNCSFSYFLGIFSIQKYETYELVKLKKVQSKYKEIISEYSFTERSKKVSQKKSCLLEIVESYATAFMSVNFPLSQGGVHFTDTHRILRTSTIFLAAL